MDAQGQEKPCPGRGDSSVRCPHEWKEGIEPVCFSSAEETGGGDTTCRCGSHAAATCMWAAGARVRLCLLCCLCVRPRGRGTAAPLGSGNSLCVCVLYPCARFPRCVRIPVRGSPCAVPRCRCPPVALCPWLAARGCAVGCEQCPCPSVLLGVFPVPRGCREGHVLSSPGCCCTTLQRFGGVAQKPSAAPSPQNCCS